MKTLKFIFLTFFLAFCYTQSEANLSKDWISYFGQGDTRIHRIAFDSVSRHIYIVGTTSEQDLGTTGVYQPVFNDSSNDPFERLDIFLAKFTTNGNLVWFTYYGGANRENSPALVLDKLGNIYLSGCTKSHSGIASPGAFKTNINQSADFIAKFNPQGQRLWGTYITEKAIHELLYGPLVAVDENNNVCIYGNTSPSDITTPGTHQPDFFYPSTPNVSLLNAYLAKFNTSGQRLWGTYFGGGFEGFTNDIHIDRQNNIYITGWTDSKTNIASSGAMVTAIDSAAEVSFLAKFNPAGQRTWSTYIHPKDTTRITSIATDAAANIYVFGTTDTDSGIATAGAWQAAKTGDLDYFLIKLNSSGQKIWGTYYGGDSEEGKAGTVNFTAFDPGFAKNRIILNRSVNPEIYISGISTSTTGIQKGCTIPIEAAEGSILAKFDHTGQLIWGSYYYHNCIFDFDLGTGDSLYFVGNTYRNNLASPNAHQYTKPLQAEAGLFGKFVEHFVCPASFTVTFDKVNDTLKAQAGYLNYQWFRNDTLLQNGPQNYFVLQGYYEGVYKLKVLDPCNCIFDSDTLFVAHPTSVKSTSLNTLELNIAPNPATNKISVQLNHAGQHEYRFRIYNILGRKVFETTSKLDTDNKKIIDLSNYAPGLYILNVENREGKANVKFIRQ